MSDLNEKIAVSIERLKAFEPKEGYHLAFSGGKDSCVIKALADMAGVKYKAVYRVTGIDPPELVHFIKQHHADVVFEFPKDADGKRITMWSLIAKKKVPPTRLMRYCCQHLKEGSGDGKMCVTGIRWAESVSRKDNQGIVSIRKKKADSVDFRENGKGGIVLVNDNAESRRIVERCYTRHKTSVNPIVEWTDDDVWEFIMEYNIPYCCLYDQGFKRIGCIGCPMAQRKNREIEFARWPRFKKLYLNAFEEMLRQREANELPTERWQSAEDVFRWWMEYDVLPGQTSLFEEE